MASNISRSIRVGGLILAAATVSPLVSDAVLVSPHALFIDHRTRTGQFTLANSSDEPEEVAIELKFGYPETDSLGNPFVRLIDEPDSLFPSAAGWIRAFPRRVRLEPGQRQVVRFLATPPSDLADREYWSRIIVTSRHTGPIQATADADVRVGLTFELRTILALIYRKGQVHTGVDMHDFRAAVEGDSLEIWLALERAGNAAYLGSAKFRLEDETGTAVRNWQTAIAVYYSLNRRMALPLDGLPSGRYRLRFELSTVREDIPQSSVLPAQTITRFLDIEVE